MSKGPPYPLSIGLLVSMAVRMDHSFGIKMGVRDDLDAKQQSLIRKAYDAFFAFGAGTLENRQVAEEIEGNGFYMLHKEESYRGWLTPASLEYAENLLKMQDFLSGGKS